MRNSQKPNVPLELKRLKDFQRTTVELVHRRLWLDDDSTGRFLVADEVGLGKTMVARGVIAKGIQHLWGTRRGRRIDIVYICSNAQIARQNLQRLNVADYDLVQVDRLSMLPLVVGRLRDSRVNILSLTPGTSMAVSRGGGRVGERALLHHLLAAGLDNPRLLGHKRWIRFFRAGVGAQSYQQELGRVDPHQIDAAFARKFVAQLRRRAPGGSVLELATALAERLAHVRELSVHGVPEYLRDDWRPLIGRMRHEVASASVALLDPDLVLLDEFQKFRKYLRDGVPEDDPDRDAIELARTIFDHRGTKVLLLSATPYSMFTLPADPSGEDHEDDFVVTTAFLGGKELARRVQANQRIVRDIALGHGDPAVGNQHARAVEEDLRQVMCRTERLASTPDRDGMLTHINTVAPVPTIGDVRALGEAIRLAEQLGLAQDPFEFWRSAPYLANLMEGYELKRRLKIALAEPSPELERLLLRKGPHQLPWTRMKAYKTVDLGNAKLRVLWADLRSRSAHLVPWMPASLSYYESQGTFKKAAESGLTKRLVFSAWAVAPRAISTLLSYQAEQESTELTGYDSDHHQRLAWSRGTEERMGAMPVFALTHPFMRLAELGDPREVVAELGTVPASVEEVRTVVSERIQTELERLPAGPLSGPVDERWYWAAGLVMDDDRYAQLHRDHLMAMGSVDPDALYAAHVDEALATRHKVLRRFGRQPGDLLEVLTSLAIAGPGVCAMRALHRVTRKAKTRDPRVRAGAHAVGLAMRSFVYTREITQMISAQQPEEPSSWRAVLATCFGGNLQATLDEYAHVLLESEGLQGADDDKRLRTITGAVADALTLRAGTPRVDIFGRSAGGVVSRPRALRTHFAVRYGREQADEKTQSTETRLRDGFTSPFWPFVLASTSVGQEGLDFHTYCHAVVHWNLPHNPVDLEQREGRVHRYKGHAVRKNVAANHASSALDLSVRDPWSSMFESAHRETRAAGLDDIAPFWVYPRQGGATIERYVLANPLSRETARLAELQRTLAAYRLTLGQPRQDDLVHYVGDRPDLEWMLLDLSPR